MPSMLDPNPFQPVPLEPVRGGNSAFASLPSLVSLLIVALMAFAAGFVLSESTSRWISVKEIQAINQAHSLTIQQLVDTNADLSERLHSAQQHQHLRTQTASHP